MSVIPKKYISEDLGLGYKKILDHFRNQAKGGQSILLINKPANKADIRTRFTKPTIAGSLILVDLADKEHKNEKMPNVEVMDPTEPDRRRALQEVAEEQWVKKNATDGGRFSIKRPGKGKRAHSTAEGFQGQTLARKAVKRAKDLFDI